MSFSFGKRYDKYITYRGKQIPFDIDLALHRGVFISGGKGSGKTNLMKIIVNEITNKTVLSNRLITKGDPRKVVVKVVDPSQAWLRSSIPYYQEITLEKILKREWDNPLNINCVYDTSRLYPIDQKLFIAELLGSTFEYIVNNPIPIWLVFVLEESQMVFPSGSLRAFWAQEGLRAITVGRNYDESVLSLTQFPATVSTNLIKAVGLSYFGVAWEDNDLRKLQRFTKWKRARMDAAFPNLDIGEFVFLHVGKGSRAFTIKTPEFIPKSEPEEWIPQKKQNFWRKLF